MSRTVLVADRSMLVTGSSTTDPVAIAQANAVDVEVVLVSLSGTSFAIAFLGANQIDGNYVATGPAALVLTRSPDVQIYQLGVTPWAFVKVQFVASSASVIFSAKIRLYSK